MNRAVHGGHRHFKIISILVAQTVEHNVMGSIPGECMPWTNR